MSLRSLFSSVNLLCALSSTALISAQSIPGASYFAGNGAPFAGAYQLIDDYEPSIFFNKFNFYSSYDPTYGHVSYVNQSVAVQNGFVSTTSSTARIGVDTTNKWPRGGPGRPSVRVISDNTYTHGLFIFDANHMPWGCGTWPAYWLLGPNWPYTGEIDSISLHSSANCSVAGTGQTGTIQTTNCDVSANGNSGCGSTLSNTTIPNNYGSGYNTNAGGVYATEWTSSYFKTWFFPRGSIPSSITSGKPDVSTFGTPAVNHQGSCNIDSHFSNMSIIINIDFCGAWAGQVYSQYSDCPQSSTATNSLDSCVDFVGNNPGNFTNAYWEINSIKVYQMPVGAQASSSYTTSLSSATPASTATTNSINRGNGQSTSVSSAPYTGPLSSVTTSASAATSTPVICPTYNTSTWTDSNKQGYTIGCGLDYNGAGGGIYSATSFENCLEICDTSSACLAVAFVGGNGAGTCYTKTTQGAFIYNGATNAGIKTNATASSSTSSSAQASSSPSSPSCPSAASSTFTDSQGVSYGIICYTDYTGNNIGTPISINSLSGCLPACDSMSGCAGAVFNPFYNLCQLKSSFTGTQNGNTSVIAARRNAVAAAASSSSKSSSTTTLSNAGYGYGYGGNPPAGYGSAPAGYGYGLVSTTHTTTTSSTAASSGTSTSSSSIYTSTSSLSSISMTFTTAQTISSSSSLMVSSVSSTASSSLIQMTVSSTSTSSSTSTPASSSQSFTSTTSSSSLSSEITATTSSSSATITSASSSTTSKSELSTVSSSGTTSLYQTESTTLMTSSSDVSSSISTVTSDDLDMYMTSDSSTSSADQSTTSSDSSAQLSSSLVLTTSSTIPSSSVLLQQTSISTIATSITQSSGVSTSASVISASACPSNVAGYCGQTQQTTTCADTAGTIYSVSCGMVYTGDIIDTSGIYGREIEVLARAQEPNVASCQSLCDRYTYCVGFNYIGTNCVLLSRVVSSVANPSAIGGSVVRAAPSLASTSTSSPATIQSYGGSTPSSSLGSATLQIYGSTTTSTVASSTQLSSLSTSVTSSSSQPAQVTVTTQVSTTPPVTVVTTMTTRAPPNGYYTSGPSGSYYVYTSSQSGSASLCFTCSLTPTVVTGSYGPPSSTCSTTRFGTTTIFTTSTITSCAPQPTCPASGYYIIGGLQSYPGQQVVTTTDHSGGLITYTQIPTGTTGNGGGGPVGYGSFSTSLPATGSVTTSGSGSGSTAQPVCPASNGKVYVDGMGMQYMIYCDVLFSDTTLDTQTQSTLAGCIASCDMYNTRTFYLGSQCLGVSWYANQTSNNCLLKGGASPLTQRGCDSCALLYANAAPNNTYNTNGGTGGSGTGTGYGYGTPYTTVVGGTTSVSVYTTTLPASTITIYSTIYTNGQTTTIPIGYTTIPASTVVASTTVVQPGSTVVTQGPAGPGYYGGGGGGGGGSIASTVYSVSTAVSTYVSNGQTIYSTYGVTTAQSIMYLPGTTETQTVTTTSITLVPTTIVTTLSQGVTTTIVSYVPAQGGGGYYGGGGGGGTNGATVTQTQAGPTQTKTITTTSYSVTTVATTIITTVSQGYTTTIVTSVPVTYTIPITTYEAGGGGSSGTDGGGRGTVTVTESGAPGTTVYVTLTVTQTVLPSSTSSSFTCRTYATNYLNGLHGRAEPTSAPMIRDGLVLEPLVPAIAATKKRSIFEKEIIMAEVARIPRGPYGVLSAEFELWFVE